jgi:hypothetical protein
MREAESVWGRKADLGGVLNICTDVADLRKLGLKGRKVLLACIKPATSAEIIAQKFHKDQGGGVAEGREVLPVQHGARVAQH